MIRSRGYKLSSTRFNRFKKVWFPSDLQLFSFEKWLSWLPLLHGSVLRHPDPHSVVFVALLANYWAQRFEALWLCSVWKKLGQNVQQIVPLGIYFNRKIYMYHYKLQHYNLFLTSDKKYKSDFRPRNWRIFKFII